MLKTVRFLLLRFTVSLVSSQENPKDQDGLKLKETTAVPTMPEQRIIHQHSAVLHSEVARMH